MQDAYDEGSNPDGYQATDALEKRGAELPPATFLLQVTRGIEASFAGSAEPLHTRPRSRLAQFWFGPDPSIHYEIWIHERVGRLEIGLHCESTSEYNRLLYRAFDRCMLEIQAQLGPQFWLEEWDHGWIRLYETHPLEPLDSYKVASTVERLGEIVSTLQPLYGAIAADLPAPPPSRVDARSQRGRNRAR